jgi:hypothetical protein
LAQKRPRQRRDTARTERRQDERPAVSSVLRRFTIKSWALTSQVLQERRNRVGLLDLMGFYDWLGESNLKSILRHLPPLPCRAGCAYCCYVGSDRPDLLPIELFRIVTYLNEADAHVRAHVAAQLGAPRDDPKAPCLFLSGERCTIYRVRPMRCRAQHSPDVVACRESHAGQRPTFPLLREPALLFKSIATGIRLGLRDAGLEHAPLSMAKAMTLALEDARALERWLAGESVFREAAYPGVGREEKDLGRLARHARPELQSEQAPLQPVLSIFGERPGAWYAYTTSGLTPFGSAGPRSV